MKIPIPAKFLVVIALVICQSAAVGQMPTARRVVCLDAVDYAASDPQLVQKPLSLDAMSRTDDEFRGLMADVGRAGNVPILMTRVPRTSVTRDGILTALRQLDVTAQTTLVVYYHGHGATDGIRGHFLA